MFTPVEAGPGCRTPMRGIRWSDTHSSESKRSQDDNQDQIPALARGQHLSRHVAIQGRVLGAIDLAHAAFADLGGDLIGAVSGTMVEVRKTPI